MTIQRKIFVAIGIVVGLILAITGFILVGLMLALIFYLLSGTREEPRVVNDGFTKILYGYLRQEYDETVHTMITEFVMKRTGNGNKSKINKLLKH
jgi:hypothetical protein